MSFKKLFRAVPIHEGAHYAARKRKRQQRRLAVKIAAGTMIFAAVGGGSFTTRDHHEDRPARERGGGWSYPHCDAARAAGAGPFTSLQRPLTRLTELRTRPALTSHPVSMAAPTLPPTSTSLGWRAERPKSGF
jgi:hypothetical protein